MKNEIKYFSSNIAGLYWQGGLERGFSSFIDFNSSDIVNNLGSLEICYMKMAKWYFNGYLHKKCGSKLYANVNGTIKCKVCNEFVRKKSDMKKYVKPRKGGWYKLLNR